MSFRHWVKHKFRQYLTLNFPQIGDEAAVDSLLTPQLFKNISNVRFFTLLFSNRKYFRSFKALHPGIEVWIWSPLQIVSCQIQLFSHVNRASQARWEEKCCPNTMGKNCMYYSSLVLPAPLCWSAWKSWQCMLHSWFILYENTLPQASVTAHAFTVKHDLKVE